MHINASRTIEVNQMNWENIESLLNCKWMTNQFNCNGNKIWVIVIDMDWKYVQYWLNDLLSEP